MGRARRHDESDADDLSKPTAPSRPDRFPAGLSVGVVVAVLVAFCIITLVFWMRQMRAAQMARAAAAQAAARRAIAAATATPEAPKGEAIADPELRAVRAQFDAIMAGLLAGKFDADPDLSPVARKLKGYRQCRVQSQRLTTEKAAQFDGVLTGPAGRARFGATVVKQPGGAWAVDTFSGPNPE